MSQLKTIGRVETISILDLELFDLDAKIDTGAYSNSLHCDDIFVDEDNFVHFKLLDKIHPSYHGKKLKIPLYKTKSVKSSNGVVQTRASIKVQVKFEITIFPFFVPAKSSSSIFVIVLIFSPFIFW